MPIEGMGILAELVSGAIEIAAELFAAGAIGGSSTERRRSAPKTIEREVDGIATKIIETLEWHQGQSLLVVRIEVGANLGLPVSLAIGAQGMTAPIGDYETGDEQFDNLATVAGLQRDIVKILGPAVRDRLGQWLMSVGGEMKGGRLVYEEHNLADRERLPRLIEGMVEVCKLMWGTEEARLYERATADPVPRMRAAGLLLLREHHPGSPCLKDAVLTGSKDRHPMVRTLAIAMTPAVLKYAEDGTIATRVMAIRTLALTAGVDAVERLLPLTEGLFTNSAVKAAATAAVARIQGRAGGAKAGALTLSDLTAGEGGISLADGGDLSLSE